MTSLKTTRKEQINERKTDSNGHKNKNQTQTHKEKANERQMPCMWQKNEMNHIETKHRIKEIPDISSFNQLLDLSTLSETDKTILRMYYLAEKDMGYIADALGFCESTVKKRHKKSLQKLSKLL